MKKVKILRDTDDNDVNDMLVHLQEQGKNIVDIQSSSSGNDFTKINVMIVYE